MDQLFYPKSVVVVGVSERPDNLARNIVENLFEFQFNGEIFLVGKREGILIGRRICTSMEDLREGIDVAVILTPASTVPGILESCGQKGIRWAIIETGGFREYSEEGAQLENEILQITRKWGIRIVGPNGLGIMNVHNGFVVPFVKLRRGPVSKGKVSILAQSGGVLLGYANLLTSANVGILPIDDVITDIVATPSHVAAGTRAGQIVAVDLATYGIASVPLHDGKVQAIAAQDGTTVAVATSTGSLYLLDLPSLAYAHKQEDMNDEEDAPHPEETDCTQPLLRFAFRGCRSWFQDHDL